MNNNQVMSETEMLSFLKKKMSPSIINDDCYSFTSDKQIIMSSDMLVEQCDFPENMDYFSRGWKTAAVNISDIVAKGGLPKYFLFSCGLRKDQTHFFPTIIDGLQLCLKHHKLSLVGGDISESAECVFNGTIIGETDHYVGRKGAKAGDLICCTGEMGSAFIGLTLLQHNVDVSLENTFIKAFLQPKITLSHSKLISSYASASMDISDGLSESLYQLLSDANNLGFEIDFDKLPVNKKTEKMCSELNLDYFSTVVYGGEEFSQLFTVPVEYESIIKKNNKYIFVIGEVTRKNESILIDTHFAKLKRKGWKHFI